MAGMDADSVDSICTDPPYGLSFMGCEWDHGVPGAPFWTAALRVAKPGAHLLAFGGTRTFHRLACAIEDAGWEMRDTLCWLYGQGFPKSLNGVWGGTALKPAWEPIIMARKPPIGTVAKNFERFGTAGLNVDACRIPIEQGNRDVGRTITRNVDPTDDGWGFNDKKAEKVESVTRPEGRWPANVCLDEEAAAMLDEQSGVSRSISGGRSGSNANPMSWTERNHDRPRNGHNDSGGASRFFYCAKASRSEREAGLSGDPVRRTDGREKDIENPRLRTSPVLNHHPTVKPISLMRWLCRLVTPPGGIVLDPFAGSGSTGCAAVQEHLGFIGIEQQEEYVTIANARVVHWYNTAEPTLPLLVSERGSP